MNVPNASNIATPVNMFVFVLEKRRVVTAAGMRNIVRRKYVLILNPAVA